MRYLPWRLMPRGRRSRRQVFLIGVVDVLDTGAADIDPKLQSFADLFRSRIFGLINASLTLVPMASIWVWIVDEPGRDRCRRMPGR